jgi:Pentapeptide repeats (8 copies)
MDGTSEGYWREHRSYPGTLPHSMQQIHLSKADLFGAILIQANLHEANLIGANDLTQL